MSNIEKRQGISGLTSFFKECIPHISNSSTIVFSGSVGVCTPFAELLSYAVKNDGHDLIYVPKAELSQARLIQWRDSVGFVVGDKAEISQAEVLVILGGLAMPKFGVPIEDIEELHNKLGNPRLIGVGFMDIFEKSGWANRLPFSAIINSNIDAGMWLKEQP